MDQRVSNLVNSPHPPLQLDKLMAFQGQVFGGFCATMVAFGFAAAVLAQRGAAIGNEVVDVKHVRVTSS